MSLGAVEQTKEDEESGQYEGVLVQATLPPSDLALGDTLTAGPNTHIRSGTAAGGTGVLPLLWAQAPDHDQLETTLREGATTTSVARLSSPGEKQKECLYRLSWDSHVRLVIGMLTGENGTIVEAGADHDEWRIRMLYPSHEALRRATMRCEQYNVSIEVQSIRQLNGEFSGRCGLTDAQFQSLKLACEHGYFGIPREVSLEELSEVQGISHQALSERLRRGTQQLITQSLFCGGGGGFDSI